MSEASERNAKEHEIKQNPDGSTYISGLKETAVSSPEQFVEVMRLGASNRAVAGTNMNQHSRYCSRACSLFNRPVDADLKSSGR